MKNRNKKLQKLLSQWIQLTITVIQDGRVDFRCQECNEQIQQINPKCIRHNVPTLWGETKKTEHKLSNMFLIQMHQKVKRMLILTAQNMPALSVTSPHFFFPKRQTYNTPTNDDSDAVYAPAECSFSRKSHLQMLIVHTHCHLVGQLEDKDVNANTLWYLTLCPSIRQRQRTRDRLLQ